MRGDVGTITVSLTPAFRAVVLINPGWQVYLGRTVVRRRMPVPTPASGADVRSLLMQGFDRRTGAWRLGQRLELTFVRVLGSAAGTRTLGQDLIAQELAKGGFKKPYGKARFRKPR
jgi:hypothetical protein